MEAVKRRRRVAVLVLLGIGTAVLFVSFLTPWSQMFLTDHELILERNSYDQNPWTMQIGGERVFFTKIERATNVFTGNPNYVVFEQSGRKRIVYGSTFTPRLENVLNNIIRERAAAKGRSWGPEQAVGPADTLTAGDLTTAWASLSPDGQREWLLLQYARPTRPAAIEIYETFNPGAVDRVCVFTPDGQVKVVWKRKAPRMYGEELSKSVIPVQIDFSITQVKLYLNCPQVPGWNEIDAVRLVDTGGNGQWAASATASSTFAAQ